MQSSAGDLLRAAKDSGTPEGNQIAAIMREGKLVPLETTLGLLKKAMTEKQGKCFLIDGFPRAQDQATKFEEEVGLPGAVLFFDCPEEEMEKRLLKRGETSGRADDNAEAIKKRFKTFVEESKPVQGHYEAKGLAKVISAVPPPDDVFQEVIKALDPLLKGGSAPSAAEAKPAEEAKPAPAAPAAADPPPAAEAAPAAPEEAPAPAAPAPEQPAAEAPAPEELAPADAAPAGDKPPLDYSIVFVLGGPGSGKGTQCEKIKERYAGVVHLSAGDLLRAERDSGSEAGEMLDSIMREGKLVPVEITIGLLKTAMEKNREGMKMVLIDGFPRALDQAARFENDVSLPSAVLFFDCPEEEMEKRLLKRGETSGRSDDNAEAIRKRFKTFVNESLPVKGHYESMGRAYTVSAVPPPDEVFEEVTKVLDSFAPTNA
ncbi:adenylate kinase-domain-containing protein [Dunaliella salina]|uniref:UMP-CMP kinase n=2 Tax=Dunaliella salina TaxID=3046 RepID=A0ABQ7G5I0_DUNSA|nr:adenylate kinase-domain-containing protein [Dunaliella salina]|eukprot:KAF5829811.1 adenylate kinase-domain-containing protein [Dunaliella salina]